MPIDIENNRQTTEKELFQSLSQSYSEILPPNKETLLLIVWLYKKVENGYISEEFEEKDFYDTFDEVKDFLQIEKDKNVELTLSTFNYDIISCKSIEFLPDGELSCIMGNSFTTKWTKDLAFFDMGYGLTANKYEIRVLDGKEYLFLEWKTSDYVWAVYIYEYTHVFRMYYCAFVRDI